MKRLIRKLFPNYVTRADLTITDGEIGGDIKLLQGRIALLEQCIALSADAVEIAAARIYAAEQRIEELEAATFVSADKLKELIRTGKMTLNGARDVLGLNPHGELKGDDAFEPLPLAPNGRATRTQIVEIKPKGRGPKGAK